MCPERLENLGMIMLHMRTLVLLIARLGESDPVELERWTSVIKCYLSGCARIGVESNLLYSFQNREVL